MSEFDVHITAIASDYMKVTADSKKEAIEKMQDMIEHDFEFIKNMLILGIEFIEPEDVRISDVLDFDEERK